MFFKFERSKVKVGIQDFSAETVRVYDGEETEICKMFMDQDGDLGFHYKNKPIYFRECFSN